MPSRAAFGGRFWEGVLWEAVLVSAPVGAIAFAGGWSASGLAEQDGLVFPLLAALAVAFAWRFPGAERPLFI